MGPRGECWAACDGRSQIVCPGHVTHVDPRSCGSGTMGHKTWTGVSRFAVKRSWEGLAMTQFPRHMLPACYSERALDKKGQCRSEGLGVIVSLLKDQKG